MALEYYFILRNEVETYKFVERLDQDTNLCYVLPTIGTTTKKHVAYLHKMNDNWSLYGIAEDKLKGLDKMTLWSIKSSTNWEDREKVIITLCSSYQKVLDKFHSLVTDNRQTHYFYMSKDDVIDYSFNLGDKHAIKTTGNINIIFESVGNDIYKAYLNPEYNSSDVSIRLAPTDCRRGTIELVLYKDISSLTTENKKETKMGRIVVKKVKFSGPATIVFWSDGSKSVVKCKDEKFDPEKGLAMALAKGMTKCNNQILMKDIHIFDCGIEVVWFNGTTTEMYWKDETHDIEKHIALAKIKKSCALVDGVKNTKWYSKFQAIFKKYYEERPVAKVIDNLSKKEKTTMMQAFANSVVEAKSETSRVNELLKRAEAITREEEFQSTELAQDLDTDQTSKILAMFNQGFSISKIAKQTGISEYYVKRYLDTVTNPNLSDKSKKPERILRKALKSSAKKDKKEKKERKPRPRMTSLIYPEYLEKEECDKLVELTKEKYADKPNIRYLSELQKYFIRECRRYKTMQLWGNGYSAFEIGKIIGIGASGVMKYVKSGEADKE